jgi:hypothetical protein
VLIKKSLQAVSHLQADSLERLLWGRTDTGHSQEVDRMPTPIATLSSRNDARHCAGNRMEVSSPDRRPTMPESSAGS